MTKQDYLKSFEIDGKRYNYFDICGFKNVDRLPYSIRILLENLIRNLGNGHVKKEHIESLLQWPETAGKKEIPFMPARVIMQDFTGVPGVVDLAAMRSAVARMGSDPSVINPIVHVDLIIDHSVQVDYYGVPDALKKNMKKEFERNSERYRLLKWAQKSFKNFRVVPPGTGIIHQVNLEYLSKVVIEAEIDGNLYAYPDTLVGTDSHTTMINGISVMGWGVGGIEAEAVTLGQPYYMLIPDVVGFKLSGKLREGVTATDLVLTVTQMLRKHGVVGKFVEFFGPGVASLTLPNRATLANMAPEYGATMGFFPTDRVTIDFLKNTAREKVAELVAEYTERQGLLRQQDSTDPEYTAVIELDMADVKPSLAGPKRPQDRIDLGEIKSSFESTLKEMSHNLKREGRRSKKIKIKDAETELKDGAVVIAAITSCTNTSNPSVLIGAGLLAKKAVERGLTVKPYVKTSFAPGSRVVPEYLKDSGLLPYLEKLGFHVVGFGCTTCIGNAGPLPYEVADAIVNENLIVTSVLSGNRNFEARIHPLIRGNYLASPPLVVAFAIAGRIDIDFEKEPLGINKDGKPVYLRDIWPTQDEIDEIARRSIFSSTYERQYSRVMDGDENWRALDVAEGELYDWDKNSTYIQEPPFFIGITKEVKEPEDIKDARILMLLGDSVTTDHISPAGSIPEDGPAGRYLIDRGISKENFNTFGSRRGNHEVMMRGTFANVRIKNRMFDDGREGGWTIHVPSGEIMSVYDAAMRYAKEHTPLVVMAGKEYGTGSSRDWAAKGTALLGVKAVIAESFERIHRSNLVGMGVLPLEFVDGQSWSNLGITGKESISIEGIKEGLYPGKRLKVILSDNNVEKSFEVKVRLDSDVEIEYYKNGGILQKVLRDLI